WFDNPTADAYPGRIYTSLVGKTKIKPFICPSAPEGEPENNAFGTGMAGGGIIGGTRVRNLAPRTPVTAAFWYKDYNTVETLMPFGICHYVGCAGLGKGNNTTLSAAGVPYSSYEGIYVSNNPKKITDILDGSSNTIAFSEVAGRSHASYPGRTNAFAYSWLGAASVTTGFGTNSGKAANVYQMSSYHTGVVLVALGDGSVRSVRNNISANTTDATWLVLQAMGGVADGVVADFSSVMTN